MMIDRLSREYAPEIEARRHFRKMRNEELEMRNGTNNYDNLTFLIEDKNKAMTLTGNRSISSIGISPFF